MAPQGFLASGDEYTRRYDDIKILVPRKTKCVDDTVLLDEKLADHWWCMIDYLEFPQKEIAGFTITKSEIKPQEKLIKAIRDFPML